MSERNLENSPPPTEEAIRIFKSEESKPKSKYKPVCKCPIGISGNCTHFSNRRCNINE